MYIHTQSREHQMKRQLILTSLLFPCIIVKTCLSQSVPSSTIDPPKKVLLFVLAHGGTVKKKLSDRCESHDFDRTRNVYIIRPKRWVVNQCGGLGHLKIQTRLRGERFGSVMDECAI